MNDQPTGLVTIERFVAFVLGPAVTLAASWLSVFLLKTLKFHVEPSEIVGALVVGGTSAAGLAYKWLHGKQVEMKMAPLVAEAQNSLPAGANELIHTTLHDLEGLAQSAAAHAVASLTGGGGGDGPPVPLDPNDPAPAGTADQGAASGV